MSETNCIGILFAGDREARLQATPQNPRFVKIFEAFADLGIHAEPVVYHDDFCAEVKAQVLKLDAVVVWVNPIEGGRDRSKLDAMLRECASKGVYVSTHPDTILKLGTKEVVYLTRNLGWGSDTHLYLDLDQMRRELPRRLEAGEVRVLKQYRGHSGDGIWKIQRDPSGPTMVRVRHAKTGSPEETIMLDEFFERCVPYFSALDHQGRMIDQIYQSRLPEGMVRCYLVGGKVEGFGRQEVVALHPTLSPVPRHYHPNTMPEFQRLKHQVEEEWVPAARRLLGIEANDLPALWDCDFLFGPKDNDGQDSYILCEINVSCVSPFPESTAAPLAKYVRERLRSRS